MRTKMKKLFCVSLTAMLAFSTVATGCFGGGGGGNSDAGTSGLPDSGFNDRYDSSQKADRTQLTVGVYDGGLGYAWAQQLAYTFEEKYKDVSFETGKTGVYVSIQNKKLEYEPDTLIPNLQGNVEKVDVYIVSGSGFEKYLEADVALDMTDVMTEKVYDANGEVAESGTKSIVDRIDPYFVDAYNYGTTAEPKYMHIPYEWGIRGFVYDYDLFEEEGWLTYSGYDGVPKTTAEFIDLLNKINVAGYYGYTMSPGDAGFYVHDYQHGFLAQYEGEEKAMLNLTYDGTATFAAGTFDAATCTAEGITTAEDGTQSVTITDENAWLLSQQAGKNEFVKFLRQIIDEKYFSPTVKGNTQSFTEAQKEFIMSAMPGQTRIAMLFDGEWWENEARTQFNSMNEINTAYGYGKRDFRFMPIPQAEGGVNEKQSFLISGSGPCFINKNTQQAKLAKLWIQMMYSQTGCKTILQNTGMTLPMEDFTMSETELANLTPFARSTYKIKTSEDIEIYMVSTEQQGLNQFAVNGRLPMSGYGYQLSATTPKSSTQATQTITANNVFTYFLDNLGFTAEKWIEGSATLYSKTAWEASYDEYFGN